MKNAITVVFLLLTSISLFAQEAGAQKKGLAELSDSSYSGYKDHGVIGGPNTIEANLEVDNQKKEPYFRLPIKVFKPWFDWKKSFMEHTGIQFGVNYTATSIWASSGITDESETSAASGVFDITASMTLIGKESGNTGTFAFKFENRHLYSKTAPMFLGFQTGSILLPATKFREFSFRFTEFYWQQVLFDTKVQLVIGKVDLTNYFTFFGLVHPFKHFTGYAFSTSPSVNWPNQGFGIIASYMPTKNIYIMGTVADVIGDPFGNNDIFNTGDNFFNGKFFKAVEVGYVPSYEDRYFKKVSVTYWNSDEVEGSSMGEGIAFASHWFIDGKYIPFLIAGYSNGGGANTMAETIVSLGNGFRFKSHDILGVGLNWTSPPGDLRDQYSVEVFYRFNLTERFEITPDLQYIINPSLDESKNSLTYFAIRGRITL
ncbi:MAG: carbohydrate porin [Melioribacteraceae bacterium]|nr:carbohydrate porin [Melioribacteraceae bacterium]